MQADDAPSASHSNSGLGPWVRLARVQAARAPREQSWSIAPHLAAALAHLQRETRHRSTLDDAWEQVIPETLRAGARIASFARGVLTIKAADASTRFELDRMLRAGGERALQQRAPVTLRRIRIIG